MAACGASGPEQTGAPPAAIPVTATPVVLTDVVERIEAGGVVTAGVSATLTSRVLAPVVDVRARAGDRVRRGDVLVVLDDGDLDASARQARAMVSAAELGLAAARTDLAAAVAEQELAEAWHARIASLQARNSATAQELDEARARLSGATARADGARARIEQASSGVMAATAAAEGAAATQSFAVIRAPFDGLVTETLTDPGNVASPGLPLLRMESAGAPRVDVTLDESRVPHVRVGDRVEVLFETAMEQASSPDAIEGIVAEVARTVAADQRAFTVKVTLPPDYAGRSGTFARVRFPGPARQALLVPAGAVRRQGQVSTVFVAQGDVARLRLLQIGRAGPEGVEVLAGVESGELVLMAPPPGLRDGQPISVTETPPGVEDRP